MQQTSEVNDANTSLGDLCSSIKSLYKSRHLSDVLLIFDFEHRACKSAEKKALSGVGNAIEVTIPAHRLILSMQSMVFQNIFEGVGCNYNPKEYRFPVKVHIKDTSSKVFSIMLKFIYTYSTQEIMEMVKKYEVLDIEDIWLDLLAASCTYAVPAMTRLCVDQILDKLTKMNKRNGYITFSAAQTALSILIYTDIITDKAAATSECRTAIARNESCDVDIALLQRACIQQILNTSDEDLMHLLRAEEAQICNVKRICEILRHRFEAPLVKAVEYQLSQVVHELLCEGEPIDRCDISRGITPIDAALATGNDLILRRLFVKLDADVALLLNKSIPTLFLACASGNTLYCQKLLKQDTADVIQTATVDTTDKQLLEKFGRQQTPLHVACRHGHEDIIQLLIENGAIVNMQDSDGNCALHYCISSQAAKRLLDSSSVVDMNIINNLGQTPLHVAAANGRKRVVQLLQSRGAVCTVRDNQGQTPFLVAASKCHVAICSIFVSSFSHPDRNNVKKKHVASYHASNESIDQVDYQCNTALHLVAISKSLDYGDSIKFLLAHGADPSISNYLGYTPLHLFCSHRAGPSSVISILLQHKVDINKQGLDGSTALHFAVGQASEELAVALVIAGARVDLLDEAGRSVFDLAERKNQGKMIVPLVRNIVRQPSWSSMVAESECASCHILFSMTVRRHHCRHCGRPVCYTCSSNKIMIPKFQLLKPCRVCDTCFQVLTFQRVL